MKSITNCQSTASGLSASDHCVSPPSTPPDPVYIVLEDGYTWDGVLKENSSRPVTNSTRIAETMENKGKQSEESTNLLLPSLGPTPDLLKSDFYKNSCHTCDVHFPTEKGFEKHMLGSEAHKSFKLTSDIAEEFGYLNVSDTEIEQDSFSHKSLNLPGESTLFGYPGHCQLRANELNQCTKLCCTCPKLEFDLPKQPVPTTLEPGGFFAPLFLDGSAGSTMYGKVREDEEEDTLDFSLKRPYPPSDSDEEPYIRPPDSDDDEEMAKHRAAEDQKRKDEAAAAEAERQRKRQDDAEVRWRFSKGKNRRATRIAKQRVDRAAYEAYIAMDESLFGQQRFEEVVEEEVVIPPQSPLPGSVVWTKEKWEAAIANWQGEMGQTDYIVEGKKFESELAEQIDILIMDALFDVSLQEDEEKRDKASVRYKNKLFFEDTLEDIAIDHEFGIEDKYQEKLRKVSGKEQTKKLNSLKTGDIVDDIAMDRLQEVGERGEERYRSTAGRKQTKELNHLRMDDMVDIIAMDHNQEIGEKEGERYRVVVGRAQNKKLNDLRVGDLVDCLAMDHIQEVGEKDEERHRRNAGMINNKEVTRPRMDDILDNLVMSHDQELADRGEEHRRKIVGRIQNKKMADLKMDGTVDGFAMNHNQEAHERLQEDQRKTIGLRQTKKLKVTRREEEDNLADFLVMDHMQQNRKLTTKMDDIVDNLALEHQEVKQNRKLTVARTNESVEPLANKHNKISRNKAAEEKRKSEAFLARFLSSNDRGGVDISEGTSTRSRSYKERVSGEWYGRDGGMKLPKVSSSGIETSYKIPGSTIDSVTESSPKYDGYGVDGYTNPVPIPKKTIKQKRKEAQAKYDAIIDNMARTQKH